MTTVAPMGNALRATRSTEDSLPQDPMQPPSVETPPSREQLDRSFLTSVAWSAAARWSAQITVWLSTILVARLLAPEDYGLMGMAALFMGVVAMLSEMGVGLSVLVLRDLTDEQLDQLNSVALLMGIAGFALSLVAAQPFAAFFDAPRLAGLVRALGVTFIIGGLRTIPLALLQRGLRFKRTSAIEAGASLVGAVTVVSLALAGLGYWSLAVGQIAQLAASAAMVMWSERRGFRRPRMAALRQTITFSKRVLVGNSAWYIYSNADFLVAGRLLGTSALGVYSFGWNLITVALEKVGTLVNAVTPAYFSAMQKDPAGLRRMLLGITEALALALLPATAGIALVAGDLIPVVFGAKWVAAVPVVQLLAMYNAMRLLRPVVNNVLMNTGGERFLMWMGVLSAIFFPAGFLIGSRFGPPGIAAAWLALYPIATVLVYRRLFATGVTTLREYVGALQPAVVSTAVMALAVYATRLLLDGGIPALRLAACILVGVVAYALTLWLRYRARVERFVRIVTQARRGPAASPA